MARFTLDIATPPENRTIASVPANDWARFVEPITGLETGDVISQAAFTVKRSVSDSDTAVTSVQRIIVPTVAATAGIIVGSTLTFYFRPQDTVLMRTAHLFDVQIWVQRGAETYIRTIIKGRITAVDDVTNTTTPLDAATTIDIVGDVPLTGGPGDFFQLVAEVRNSIGDLIVGYPVTWESSNPLVASVDSNGLVEFWTTGTCSITASVAAFGLSDLEVVTSTDPAFVAATEGDVPTYRSGSWTPENPDTRYYTKTGADARYSQLGHTHTFASLTSIPTTIAGYGITDFNSLGDARWSLLAHTHTFASLTSKPTTLAGYGITDAYTSAQVDTLLTGYSVTSHTHTFASLTSKPTTIAGYGITDFNSLGDARWSLLAHTHTFASLTSKPTTLSGFGITDAYTNTQVDTLLTGYSLTSHTHTFASLTSKPTTIGGYGITDFNSLGDARWSLLAHTHTYASLTSKPTTVSGFGITDAITTAGGQTISGNLTLSAVQTVFILTAPTAGASDYLAIRFNWTTTAKGFIGVDRGQSIVSGSLDGDMVIRSEAGHIRFASSTTLIATLQNSGLLQTNGLIANTDATNDIGASGANRFRDFFLSRSAVFGTSLSIGTTPAVVGSIRLPNNSVVSWRNAANSADFTLRLDTSNLFALDVGLTINGAFAGATTGKFTTSINVGAALTPTAGNIGWNESGVRSWQAGYGATSGDFTIASGDASGTFRVGTVFRIDVGSGNVFSDYLLANLGVNTVDFTASGNSTLGGIGTTTTVNGGGLTVNVSNFTIGVSVSTLFYGTVAFNTLGGGGGALSTGIANSGGVGFRLVLVPN